MSNLLKSKFLLGVMAVAIMFVGVVAVNAKTASADCSTGTTTLRVGSKGSAVACLQQGLDHAIVADGSFGPKTKAAVIAWQKEEGLTADGVFGAKSRAEWVTAEEVAERAGNVSGLPAGCTSTSGFSPTTGVACNTGGGAITLPAGCTSTSGFSATTGLACNGGVTVNNGPVSVSLATNNPASGTLVAGQATADLAHFNFTGTGTVTGITLQRIGVSADATASNIYLFDGATRLTDAASISNNGMVTFSIPAGIFTVNGSRIISVKSDIATGTSGQTLGFMLSTFTTASGTITANLSGNIFTIASASLAAVSAGTVTPSGATLNPAPGVTVWQSTLNVSNRDVWLKRIALRNVGSAPAASFQNFKLYVNGLQVGTATGLDINGYVTFDLNAAPVLLQAGSRVVRVDADIVSGASRTVQFSLRQAADVDFVDSSFGVNIAPTGTPWAATLASTISGSNGGTMTVEKDVSSPSTNLTVGGNDAVLGIFKLTAYGEPIKIETLKAGFTYSAGTGTANAGATLRNGRILIAGVQYGSTATLVPAGTSFTTNYTVYPGTPVLVEIHADVYDNDGTGAITAGNTILATIDQGTLNADRVDSLGSLAVPGSNISANTLTVASTSITLSQNYNYAAQNTTLPASNFKIGSYNLAGSSVENVLLTTVTVDVRSLSGSNFAAGDVTNMYIVIKDSNGNIVSQPAPLGTVIATGNTYSINYTLPKNSNLTIDVYGNLSDDGSPSAIVAGNSMDTRMQISGTALVSGSTVSSGVTGSDTILGQGIAYNASTLVVSKDPSSPVTGIVYDNQTVTTLAAKFAAVTAAYNVTNLTVTLGANANTVVQSVMLYDGATLIAQGPMTTTTTAVFSGLSCPSATPCAGGFYVGANTNKVLTVKLQLGTVGVGGGTTNSVITTSIGDVTSNMTAINASTGVSTATSSEESGSAAGSAMYAFASIPTVVQVPLASNILSNSSAKPLLRFTISGNGGDISWDSLAFKVTKDAESKIGTNGTTGITLWDVTAGGNTSVGATFSNGTNVFGTGACGTYSNSTCQIIVTPSTEQLISGSKTYELRGNITGAVTRGDYVTVTIDNNNTSRVASDQVSVLISSGGIDSPIVWSDMSASSHSTTSTDWTTDFGVKNLPVSDTLTSNL